MQVLWALATSRKALVCVELIIMAGLVLMVKIFDMHTHIPANICHADSTRQIIPEQQQQQHLITFDTVNKTGQVQQTQTMKVQKDVFDNKPARAYIYEHSQRFEPLDFNVSVAPDPNKLDTITTWWQGLAMIDWYLGAPVRYKCRYRVTVGNWFICQDEPYTITPPCLVYSFGINWDFTFDDDMTDLGCEVHLFDPSMKVEDHIRDNNSTFHNIGIGSYNTDSFVATKDVYVKGSQVWKMRTIKAIMKELGHENRVIDVFKMDVETYEWTIIDNMLEAGVFKYIRQLDVEYHIFPTHPTSKEFVHLSRVYTGLRETGMREYYVDQHQRHIFEEHKIHLQADVCYINAFFDRNNLGS
ncbi:hypothetical protein BsWGS_09306 [Bradybaena similaris]